MKEPRDFYEVPRWISSQKDGGGRWRWERDGGVYVCVLCEWKKAKWERRPLGDRSRENEVWGDIGEIVWLREWGRWVTRVAP